MKQKKEMNLNESLTFDNFIEVASNKFARRVLMQESQSSDVVHSPLVYIWGDTALGKTHLLHAFGNQYIKDGRKVIYTMGELFANEFTEALREQMMSSFYKKYEECDVLILDDIDDIRFKEQTQHTLLVIMKKLMNLGKKVVLAGKHNPYNGKGLIEELHSFIMEGLIVHIETYNESEKSRLIEAFCMKNNMEIPKELNAFIVESFGQNIKMIRGVLLMMRTYYTIFEKSMPIEVLQKISLQFSEKDKQ